MDISRVHSTPVNGVIIFLLAYSNSLVKGPTGRYHKELHPWKVWKHLLPSSNQVPITSSNFFSDPSGYFIFATQYQNDLMVPAEN